MSLAFSGSSAVQSLTITVQSSKFSANIPVANSLATTATALTWQVPLTTPPSAVCFLTISGVLTGGQQAGQTTTYVSSAFSIANAAFDSNMVITSPQPGQQYWWAGAQETVAWSGESLDTFTIVLYSNTPGSAQYYGQTIATVNGNSASYTWTLDPSLAGGTYAIYVYGFPAGSGQSTGQPSGQLSELFQVLSPSSNPTGRKLISYLPIGY